MLSRRSRQELIEDVYVKLHGPIEPFPSWKREVEPRTWRNRLTDLFCCLCCDMKRED